MNIQTGSIERFASRGIEKDVVDGATIQEIARQQTDQRALDRSDAKVVSTSKVDAAKANFNIFKDGRSPRLQASGGYNRAIRENDGIRETECAGKTGAGRGNHA